MISANKAREISIRAQYNLYDEQLRIVGEEICEAAERGETNFTIYSSECEKTSFDYSFWFWGAKSNSENWIKVNKVLSDLGYNVSFNIITFDNEKITISW